MALQDPTSAQGAIEECMDEINDFVVTLDRYPPTIVAVAMSAHLQTMLTALLECDICTPYQVREFVHELERDVLEESGSSDLRDTSHGGASARAD